MQHSHTSTTHVRPSCHAGAYKLWITLAHCQPLSCRYGAFCKRHRPERPLAVENSLLPCHISRQRPHDQGDCRASRLLPAQSCSCRRQCRLQSQTAVCVLTFGTSRSQRLSCASSQHDSLASSCGPASSRGAAFAFLRRCRRSAVGTLF